MKRLIISQFYYLFCGTLYLYMKNSAHFGFEVMACLSIFSVGYVCKHIWCRFGIAIGSRACRDLVVELLQYRALTEKLLAFRVFDKLQ